MTNKTLLANIRTEADRLLLHLTQAHMKDQRVVEKIGGKKVVNKARDTGRNTNIKIIANQKVHVDHLDKEKIIVRRSNLICIIKSQAASKVLTKIKFLNISQNLKRESPLS